MMELDWKWMYKSRDPTGTDRDGFTVRIILIYSYPYIILYYIDIFIFII